MDESGKDWGKQEEAKGTASGKTWKRLWEHKWRALGYMVVPLFDIETKKQRMSLSFLFLLFGEREEDEKLN